MITDMGILLRYMMNLAAMDAEIRDLGDEDIMEIWLQEGVPDGATEIAQIGILQSIAEDEAEYTRIENLYNELIYDADIAMRESLGDNWW